MRLFRSLSLALLAITSLRASALSSGYSAATGTISPNQQSLVDAGPFPRTWVPLASQFELDPDRPVSLEFLGQNYVTYQDNDGQWVVNDDACPHRLAPLSEGRVNRETGLLECSYHGWSFDANGACQRIPQIEPAALVTAQKSERCNVKSYPVQVHKNVLWAWLWPEDPLSVAGIPEAHPEAMVAGVAEDSSTYTRDLPYGWDTLLENLVDPSHVPFAHHGLQGSRQDAIPINMTSPAVLDQHGFEFGFQDRTRGMNRTGTGIFRAPFVIQYEADFERTPAQVAAGAQVSQFNLSSICIPTKPGWSRAIIYGAPTTTKKKKKIAGTKGKKVPLMFKVFRLLPTWVMHQLSNRFLDSDLAFLHFQEQERERRGVDLEGYFMPAPADRCVVAQRKWVAKFAHIPNPLPPAITEKSVLFDRWSQHTDHCRHCSAAAKGIQKWRKNTYRLLAISIVLLKFMAARFVAVGCLAMLRLLAAIEPSFKIGGFKHYENN